MLAMCTPTMAILKLCPKAVAAVRLLPISTATASHILLLQKGQHLPQLFPMAKSTGPTLFFYPILPHKQLTSSMDQKQLLMAIREFHTSAPGKSRWSRLWGGDDDGHNDSVCYVFGILFIMIGLSFAFIPFYQMLCEQTSFTGLAQVVANLEQIATMEKVEDRLINVQFNADVPSSMQWKFKPLQEEIYVNPGETALAFFSATNPTDKPIVGISTYNLTPFQAAYYFNKIQCFCFDEQILNPGEEVDLPVFFYIDPDYVNDPQLEDMDSILLSYTFIESGTINNLPSPFDPNFRPQNKQLVKKGKKVDREKDEITRNVKREMLEQGQNQGNAAKIELAPAAAKIGQ